MYIIAGCLTIISFLLIYSANPKSPILLVIFIFIILGIILILFGLGSDSLI